MPPDDYDHRAILDALDRADEGTALARLIPHIEAAREACLSAAAR